MYVYINNRLTTEAKISVFDRGFMFGDGLFESIRVVDGALYLWEYHVERMSRGLEALQIWVDPEDIYRGAHSIIAKNHLKEAIIKIIITRGTGGRGYLPHEKSTPNIVITSRDYQESGNRPIALLISNTQAPDTCFQGKSLQKLHSVMTKIEAQKSNCFEGLMLDRDSNVCEVSSGNIFWLQDNQLFTPCVSCGIVPGVMRRKIMEMNRVITGKFHISELLSASAIFISNIAWIALGVSTIEPIGATFESEGITKTIREQVKHDQTTKVAINTDSSNGDHISGDKA